MRGQAHGSILLQVAEIYSSLKPSSPLISIDSPEYEDRLFQWKEFRNWSAKNYIIKKH